MLHVNASLALILSANSCLIGQLIFFLPSCSISTASDGDQDSQDDETCECVRVQALL